MTRVPSRSPSVRATPRVTGLVVMVCVLLLSIGVYDALHSHHFAGPLGSAPLAPHHCLLCMTAHMPVTISAGFALPVPSFTCSAPVPPNPLDGYESALSLPLSIRPPPLG